MPSGRRTDGAGGQARGRRGLGQGTVVLKACNFLHQTDNATPELELFDAHEGPNERKPFGGGEKIRYVGR